MARISTGSWTSTGAPYMYLDYDLASIDGDTDRLNYTAYYYGSSGVYTNGVARAWSVKVNGSTVKSGSYNINRVSGTHTLGSGYVDIALGHSIKTTTVSISFNFDVSWSGSYAGTRTASGTINSRAKTSYTVSYNANGGSGAPSAQTKWYNESLTLSSTNPTRTGYTFAGWNTNSSGTGTNYSAGGAYTGNAAVTLYAKWTAITYTVSYNANGGTGAPGNQTKTYGQTLTLSSTVPTRTNYNFKGWATSASATTPNYQPGGSYTANAAITLYAVWEIAYIAPRITNVTADRCTSDGTLSEEGTYALVKCSWATDKGMNDCHIVCNGQTYGVSGVTIGATSGVFNQVVGSGTLSTENSYTIQLFVGDTMGSSTYTITLAPLAYIIDFSPEGGVAIGSPAADAKQFDVHIPVNNKSTVVTSGLATFAGGQVNTSNLYMNSGRWIYFKDINNADNLYIGRANDVAGSLAIGAGGRIHINTPYIFTNHICLRNGQAITGLLTSGGLSIMLRMNTSNQVELTWTSGGLRGRVWKTIWSGTLSQGGTITISELPYYNVFAFLDGTNNIRSIGLRTNTTRISAIGGFNNYSFSVTEQFNFVANGTSLYFEGGNYVVNAGGNDNFKTIVITEVKGLL